MRIDGSSGGEGEGGRGGDVFGVVVDSIDGPVGRYEAWGCVIY